MTPRVLHTVGGTLNDMAAYAGTSWPNPWWPTGNPKYNDCAAAVSWALFGRNGPQPYYTVVSQLLAAIGGIHMGSAGLQRGDVIGFDWGYGNNYDHTELCVAVDLARGTVTSRGTNSNPGDDMRDRTRSLRYVKSYARPAYPGFAGGGGTPIDDLSGSEHDMHIIPVTNADGTAKWYALGLYGRVEVPAGHLQSLRAVEVYLSTIQPGQPTGVNAGGADIDNWIEYSKKVNTPPASGAGSLLLGPVLDAIKALDAQDDAYQAQLLAAVATVDEATAAELAKRLGA